VIDIPNDADRLYADEARQLSLDDFCQCDIPSPVPLADGGAWDECAECRKLVAS
jgi:hypothetical protein